MPVPAHILTKVRFLLNLTQSSNANEASAAMAAADKLIAKYNISQEELDTTKDQPRAYTADSLLFKTFNVVGWMQHLSLACAKQFYCYIVIESITSATGLQEYNYYVYGDDEDIVYVKFAFNTILKKIHQLIDTRCIGYGPIYQESYCEGCVEAVKNKIYSFGIDIPERKRATRSIKQEERILINGDSNLSVHKSEKEKPEKDTVDVSRGSIIKDVAAYFKGLEDGSRISIQDIMELEVENEELEQLEDKTKNV
jgi:hypothetical protein